MSADEVPTEGAGRSEAADRLIEYLEAQGTPLAPDVAIPVVYYVSVARSDWGRVNYRESVFEGDDRIRCEPRQLVDVAGYGRTGPDGSTTMSLRNQVCEVSAIHAPVYAVATPMGEVPNYLTIRAWVSDPPGSAEPDVGVRVFSWDPGGNPSGNVWFFWRLIVPGSMSPPVVE